MRMIVFSASWCAPCKKLKEMLIKNNIVFDEIDTESHSELANSYVIRALPTVIFEKNGVEVSRVVGLRKLEEYINRAEE